MSGEALADSDGWARSEGVEDRVRMAGTMLAVQAWRCSNPLMRDELSSVARRVQAAIDQHEKRRCCGVRSIDAADYLEGLRRRLVAAMNDEEERVHLAFAVKPGALSNDGALLLGLIVNEVLADALDRAHGRPCVVAVQLERGPPGFSLTIADRQPGRAPQGPGSFGLALVRQLARELAKTFLSAPNDAGIKLHILSTRSEHALPLRDVTPRRPQRAPRLHPMRSTEEAFHEFRHN